MHRRPWKVAIVKGASQGIGAGIVAAYRRHGHAVVATSRSMALSMDSGVLSIAGDVRDRSAAERLVAAALARFGRIDTLVNNAGIFLGKPFTEYTAEEFTNVVDANLAGFFHTMQHVPWCTQAIAGAPSGLALLNNGGLDAVTRGPGAR